MISIVLKVEAWESEGAAASPSPTKISSSGVGGDSVTTPNPLPKSKPTGNNMDPELTSEGDGRDTNGDANGDAGEGLEREEGDSTSNDDLATSFSSQQQSESLERAEKVFKVGWFEGTESMEVKVGIRDAAERHLGVQGIVWRLVGEGGEVRATIKCLREMGMGASSSLNLASFPLTPRAGLGRFFEAARGHIQVSVEEEGVRAGERGSEVGCRPSDADAQ